MKKKIEVTIETPDVPNFLRNIVTGRKKAILVPIQDFTDDELKQIGNDWTKKLVSKAKLKRKKK